MKKKIFIFVMSAVFVISLCVGCSGDSSENSITTDQIRFLPQIVRDSWGLESVLDIRSGHEFYSQGLTYEEYLTSEEINSSGDIVEIFGEPETLYVSDDLLIAEYSYKISGFDGHFIRFTFVYDIYWSRLSGTARRDADNKLFAVSLLEGDKEYFTQTVDDIGSKVYTSFIAGKIESLNEELEIFGKIADNIGKTDRNTVSSDKLVNIYGESLLNVGTKYSLFSSNIPERISRWENSGFTCEYLLDSGEILILKFDYDGERYVRADQTLIEVPSMDSATLQGVYLLSNGDFKRVSASDDLVFNIENTEAFSASDSVPEYEFTENENLISVMECCGSPDEIIEYPHNTTYIFNLGNEILYCIVQNGNLVCDIISVEN